MAPRTAAELHALLPEAHIESVGEREELVIYTGLTECNDGSLVPMNEDLD